MSNTNKWKIKPDNLKKILKFTESHKRMMISSASILRTCNKVTQMEVANKMKTDIKLVSTIESYLKGNNKKTPTDVSLCRYVEAVEKLTGEDIFECIEIKSY